MFDFLLQTSFFLSLGAIIYLMVRALPRVNEGESAAHATGFFDRFLSKMPLKKIDERLDRFFEKTLRRLKILVLRIDNSLNKGLSKIRKSNGLNSKDKKPELFREINEEGKKRVEE